MSLLPGLLFMWPSAGAEAAGGQFVTHPGSMRSSFPPGTVAARGQDDDCPTHRQIPPALPCILYVYAPFSQSRHMSWTVHRSPEHPAWPGGAFQLPSKHKLILEVQNHFPTAKQTVQPCAHTAWIPRQPVPSVFGQLYKLLQKMTLVLLCYDMRGRSKVLFPPLPIQAQTAPMRTVMYSTLSASYLRSLVF